MMHKVSIMLWGACSGGFVIRGAWVESLFASRAVGSFCLARACQTTSTRTSRDLTEHPPAPNRFIGTQGEGDVPVAAGGHRLWNPQNAANRSSRKLRARLASVWDPDSNQQACLEGSVADPRVPCPASDPASAVCSLNAIRKPGVPHHSACGSWHIRCIASSTRVKGARSTIETM